MERTLLCITLGLALVLLLRKPLRRGFGAGPALALWWLPVLLAALPWLPALPQPWITPSPLVAVPSGAITALQTGTAAVPMLHGLWLLGVAACLARLVWRYQRLRRQCQPLPDVIRQAVLHDLPGIEPRRLRLHADGPGVLWGPRSLLLLPADFLSRHGAAERSLVLRHEAMHLRRHDPWWHLLGELVFAALWFHPLAWLALPRLQLDQELACDDHVLRQSPHAAAGYARALLHSTGAGLAPGLIPWLAEPQLKERLIMIQRHRAGATRRRIGFIGLGVLLAGSVWIAQASNPPVTQERATADLEFNQHITPKYPEDAVKNHEQGTVVLDVLVGVDGQPRRVTVHSSNEVAPSLIKAASDTAMQWRFNPAMKNGKPIESYARVPVEFSLSVDDKAPVHTDQAPAKPKPAS